MSEDDTCKTPAPLPMNRRPLTNEERAVVLPNLTVPPEGWAELTPAAELARALDQTRWHTFVDATGQTLKQDIVTGTVRELQRMGRRARRANKALVRRSKP